MLRIFVERKVRRQIVRRSLIISALAMIAMLFLWYTEALPSLAHPTRMFINNIHGGLTALAIQLSGGTVDSFTLSPVGTYLITFQGGSDALIFPAGYLGSAVLGALLFYAINRAPHLLRGLAIITGAFTVAFVLLFIRPAETGDAVSYAICIGLGVFLMALGWTGKGDINQLRSRKSVTHIVMTIVALMMALHILLDLQHVLSTPARFDDTIINPVAAFNEGVMPNASLQLVAYAWTTIAIGLLSVAAHFSLIRPLRQIPKDDDIV